MWFLAILVLLNAFANNSEFVNKMRITVAGMPINVFDGLITLGVLIALVRPRASAKFVQTSGMHKAMACMLLLFTVAFFGGLAGGMVNGATDRQIFTAMRNFAAAPAAVYLAYFLTANVNASRRYLYIAVAAGVVASFMILVFFKTKTETRTFTNLNNARAVVYIGAYAGLAAALLFYSISSGVRLAPVVIASVVMGACLVGQFGTLSRSDWLATGAAMGAGFVLLPKEQRVRSAIRAAMAVPVLIASLWVGLYLGSQVTGKDMFGKMTDRFYSMLPGDRAGGEKAKAWETRLPGIFRELRAFASSPVIGRGFAIQDTPEMEGRWYAGLRHNSWTATLAETGILGFAAFSVMVGGMIVCGRRMVRDRTDQTTVLIGAFGVITGVFFIFHGLSTMSFNQVRSGLPLFVTAGVVLRTRQMQRALVQQAEADMAFEEQQHVELYDDVLHPPGDGRVPGQPALGNWYQTN